MKYHQNNIRRGLSMADKKEIRNQCKMGFALSLIVFVFCETIGVVVSELFFDKNPDGVDVTMAVTILIVSCFFSIVINVLTNNKYYKDLQFNEKVQITRSLMSKSKTNIYVAQRGNIMSKAYIEKFEFVIDDISFIVDKELFESCAEGDTLFLNYTLKSEYLLGIEKM